MASSSSPPSEEVPPGDPKPPRFSYSNPRPVRFLKTDLGEIAKSKASSELRKKAFEQNLSFLSHPKPPKATNDKGPNDDDSDYLMSPCPSYDDSSVASGGSNPDDLSETQETQYPPEPIRTEPPQLTNPNRSIIFRKDPGPPCALRRDLRQIYFEGISQNLSQQRHLSRRNLYPRESIESLSAKIYNTSWTR